MKMFQQPCRATQFESFHVFKVFVANPQKPKEIAELLRRNRDEIIKFISTFQNDRSEDEQFMNEKEFIVKQMKELWFKVTTNCNQMAPMKTIIYSLLCICIVISIECYLEVFQFYYYLIIICKNLRSFCTPDIGNTWHIFNITLSQWTAFWICSEKLY